MTKVSVTTQVDIAPEKIWDLIGQFNSLPDWHPAFERSELEQGGTVRRLTLAGGGTIVERLERIDDNEHVYRYSILESPLPFTNYVGEIRVKPDKEGGGCTVEWSSQFDPKGAPVKDVTDMIQGFYQAGFDNLKKLFGG